MVTTARTGQVSRTADDARQEIIRSVPPGSYRLCCRQAEAAAILRVAGGLYLSRKRLVIEAEFDTAAVARRLHTSIAEAFGHTAQLLVLAPRGPREAARYLVRVGPGRDAEILARQAGLILSGGQVVTGMPPQVVTGGGCDCLAALRGAFLAAGTVIDQVRPAPTLSITCPTREVALALVAAGRRRGLRAAVHERGGVSQVRIPGTEAIEVALIILGAAGAAGEWLKSRAALAARPSAARAGMGDNCEAANVNRARLAGREAAARAGRALEILGAEVPDQLAEAARLRIEHQDATLLQIGALARPIATKDMMAGRLRRLISRADARAAQLGVPGTDAALTAGAA